MISLLLLSLLSCQRPTTATPLGDLRGTTSGEQLLSKELNFAEEETENKKIEETVDGDWLARIVPDFSLSDWFKPIQLQIPVLTIPDLPSYTIALS